MLFVIIPIIIAAVYTYVVNKKLPEEYDIRIIKKVYYIIVTIWLTIFLSVYKVKIQGLNIVVIKWIGSNFLNYTIIVLIWLAIIIALDYLFISFRNMKSFKVKDVEVTMDDIQEIKYSSKIDKKEKAALYNVLEAKVKMTQYIDSQMDGQDELDVEEEYLCIFNEYVKKRKNIEIFPFYERDDLNKSIVSNTDFDSQEVTSIMYSMDYNGFCSPRVEGKFMYIVAKIKTKYTHDDIIVVLKGKHIINEEHLILFDIINYFELKVDLVIAKKYASN